MLLKKKQTTFGNERNLAILAGRDCDRVSIQFPGSPNIIRHVEVVGDPSLLAIGSVVSISWRNGRPIVLPTSVPNSAEVGDITAPGPLLYPNSQLVMGITLQTSATPNYIVNTSCIYGGYFRSDNTVVGTTIDAKLILQAGTYALTLTYCSSNSGGLFDLYLDDSKFEEALQQYSSSTTLNIDKLWIVRTPFSGIHNFHAECVGKHASSANYAFYAQYLQMVLL